MRETKMTALIGASFDRTMDILFRPFSAKKWLRLILIAFLAGALFGGGNGSGGGNDTASEKKEAVQEKAAQKDAAMPAKSADEAQAAAPKASPAIVISVIIAIAALMLGLIILFTWLGSRFRFVWLNTVINNTDSIREPYYRHALEANSVFRFSLAMFAALVIFLLLDVGLAIYGMHVHGALVEGFKWSVPVGLKVFLLPAILLLACFISLIILAVIFDYFLVPMMALDRIRTLPALKKFGGIFRGQWKDIILFFLVSAGLGIVAGAGEMALAIPVIIALLLVALLVFGLPFLVLWLALKAKIIFIIYAIAAAVPFVITVVIALFATALPFAIFFRIFSLNYLVSLNAGYTKESVDRYAARRAERVGGKAPIALAITAVFVIGLVFTGGLLAAIAIPNFVKAREAAVAKQKAAVSQPATAPVQQAKPSE